MSFQYRNSSTYRTSTNYRGGISQVGIDQVAPLNDTVTSDQTEDYTSQLKATLGGVPDYPIWTITSGVGGGLNVASNGVITSSGTLDAGVYIIAGTMQDALFNSGTWSYVLTVIPLVTTTSQSISGVPAIPLAPTGLEISVPFRIDEATGGVAILSSYNAIYAQHIESIILTRLGERVMLANYGSDAESMIFSSVSANASILQSDIQQAIQQWEPAVTNVSVQASIDATNPSALTVTVSYSISPLNDVNTVTINVGGSIAQVIA